MEYVEGASLKDLIARGLSRAEAVEIVRQILTGARFAHERGIVHRDIKPQNVIVDAEGRARVTDFGIARAGASEITQTGSVMGTAQYLSPEQAQGLETTARDLYSVGVILYEVLTGRVPFDGDSAVAIALKQVSEQPRRRAAEPADPAGARRGRPAGARQGPGEPLRDGRRVPAGARRGRGRPRRRSAAPRSSPPSPRRRRPPPEDEDDGRRRKPIALGIIAAADRGRVVFALTRRSRSGAGRHREEEDEARPRILEAAGFEVVDIDVRECDDPQTVSSRTRAPASEADEGSTVDAPVGARACRSTFPTWSAIDDAEADATELEDEDLQVAARAGLRERRRRGQRGRHRPAPGARSSASSVVTMLRLEGRGLVDGARCPRLASQAASRRSSGAGFVPNVETEDSDEPEGTVIAQSPARAGAGSRRDRGHDRRLERRRAPSSSRRGGPAGGHRHQRASGPRCDQHQGRRAGDGRSSRRTAG